MDSQPEITPEMLQSNPGLLVGLVAFALFLFVAFLGSVGSWAFCGYRLFAGKSLLQTLPWKPRSWGLTELAVAFVAMVGCQVLLMELAIPLLGIERDSLAESTPLSLAAVMGLGSLLTVLITCAVIAMRFGSSATHMGFKFSGLPKQLFIGLVAGLTTIPVTMAISALVTLASEQEYDHPILDGMADEGTLTSFLLACFAAVIVAPFAEEFLFRVLLQGWLQSIPFRDVWSNLRGSEPSSGAQLSPEAMLESPVQGVLDEIEENHTPYAPPSTMEPPAPLESVENSAASVETGPTNLAKYPLGHSLWARALGVRSEFHSLDFPRDCFGARLSSNSVDLALCPHSLYAELYQHGCLGNQRLCAESGRELIASKAELGKLGDW